MKDNVIPFKKKIHKKKKYHVESMNNLEKFIEDCKDMKFQGFLGFSWMENDEILMTHSLNPDKVKIYPMIGALEKYKTMLLEIADEIDEERK